MIRLARKAISYELGMWRSLFRWIVRRPHGVHDGAEGFGYTSSVTPVLWAFIILSAIEVPAVHLLLPWRTVRTVALVLGVYGLTWMVGMLASLRVHPHVLDGSGLRVRRGFTIGVSLPWDAVAAVRKNSRTQQSSRAIQFDRTGSGLVLSLGMLSQTNVDVVLREPTAVPLAKGGGEPISELRFYADDPEALVARALEHLTAHRPTA